ncbi:hypothetical protein LJC59_00265 [Desulfovibrio sp. OttesenSCG-928-A18]|nr:hypothetical protein [Desulfovibrio sp. OttesenSCG-928-A18]
MSLQSQVYTSIAIGAPGAKADLNVFDYYPQSLAAEEDVAAGTFVWAGSDPERLAGYGGSGEPLGFVERNIVYPNYDVDGEGTMIIHEGETLTIATCGCFYAVADTDAAVGQAVFAFTANGSITVNDPGATVADAVETGWKVITAGEAGETIIIKRS